MQQIISELQKIAKSLDAIKDHRAAQRTFMRLTDLDGKIIHVRADSVVSWIQHDKHCLVTLNNGEQLKVSEPYYILWQHTNATIQSIQDNSEDETKK